MVKLRRRDHEEGQQDGGWTLYTNQQSERECDVEGDMGPCGLGKESFMLPPTDSIVDGITFS